MDFIKKNLNLVGIAGLGILIALLVGSTFPVSAQESGFTDGVLEVRLNEWSLGFDEVRVSKADLTDATNIGNELPIHVVNEGSFGHNLALEVKTDSGEYVVRTKNLQPGEETTLVVSLPAGSYELFCSIDGHAEQGMEGKLIIGEGDGMEDSEDDDYDYGSGY